MNDCTGLSSVVTTDLSTWDLSETRAQGHNELVEGGLHVWTEGNTSLDKAAGYYATDFALQDAGIPSIEFAGTPTGIRPSLQLDVDKDGNGFSDGILVYEPWSYGDGNYWSNGDFGIDPGMGYPSFGTLDDYLTANPNARVIAIGYSLGSGVQGDAIIAKLTAGCVEYTFTTPPPKPRIYVTPNSVVPGQIVTVSVTNFDPSDAAVRIRWKVGSSWVDVGTLATDVSGAGETTVTVPLNAAAGPNSVRADGLTKAQQTNAVTVTIPASPTVTLSTTRGTVGQTVSFNAANFTPGSSIAITWKRPGGSIVDLGTAPVASDGTATGSFAVPATEGGPDSRISFTGSPGVVTLSFEVAPKIKVTPSTVSPGDSVSVTLSGYGKQEVVQIRWLVNGTWVTVGTVTTNNTGGATVTVQVPANANAGPNSVRGDGTVFRQQTNAVTVTIPASPTVTLSTTRGTVGQTVSFNAANFTPSSSIAITWKRPGGSIVDLGTAPVASDGTATGSFAVPATEGGPDSRISFTGNPGVVTLSFEVAPKIKVTPSTVSPGDSVSVTLSGYGKQEVVQIRWLVNGAWVTVGTVTTNNTGGATVTVQVPANANAGPNSVRGDGTVFRQQTNAVTVVP